MAVTFVGSGSTGSGNDTVSTTVHASVATGDLTVFLVASRSTSVAPSDSGLTLIGSYSNGFQNAVAVYAKESATAGSTESFTSAISAKIVTSLTFRKASDEIWVTPVFSGGGDTSAGTGVSITGDAWGVAAGDWIAAICGINDATTLSSGSVGGMSGATLGTLNTRGTTTGTNHRAAAFDCAVTAGASSAAPTFTGTAGASVTGAAGFVRLRTEPAVTTITPQSNIPARAQPAVAVASADATPTSITPRSNIPARVQPRVTIKAGFTAITPRSNIPARIQPRVTIASGTVVTPRSNIPARIQPRVTVVSADPPPPPHWRAMGSDPVFVVALRDPGRRTRVRIDLVDGDRKLVASLPTASGAVVDWSVQAETAAVMRSCNLTLLEPTMIPRPGATSDPLHPWAMLYCQIWWELYVAPTRQWWPYLLGTFRLGDPQIGDDGTMSIYGEDPVSVVKAARYFSTVRVGGLQVHRAIQRILGTVAPLVRHSIPPTTEALPPAYEVGAPGDDPWDDVEKIAAVAGLRCFSDREGVIVAEPIDTQRPPVDVAWEEGEGCEMTEGSRTITGSAGDGENPFYNVYQAGTSSPDVDPPLTSVAMLVDPSHPARVGRYFFAVSPMESVDGVQTQAQLDRITRARLAEHVARAETNELTARVDPRPDPLDSVPYSHSQTGATGLHEVQAISMSGEALMRVQLAEKRLIETVAA